jgi:hypothetical protein
MRLFSAVLCLLCLGSCGSNAQSQKVDAGAQATPQQQAEQLAEEATGNPAEAETPELQTEPWRYPRERIIDGNRVIVYAPQIREWPDFATFEAQVAIEFHPKDGSAVRFGTTTISGTTEVDLDKRLVIVSHPKVEDVTFVGGGAQAYEEVMANQVLRERAEMPLDLFLLYLSDDVLEAPPPPGFNTAPPPIYVADSPTLLLFVNGAPVTTKVEQTGLELVVNANFPTFRDTASGTYYLITGAQRLQARDLSGPWTKATDLPAAFSKIDPKGEHAAIVAALATPASDEPAPAVIATPKPAELIVTDGKPELEAIPGADGLSVVSNTDSPLFVLDKSYYFLVSGRWFTTKQLTKGPWKFVAELPDAFSAIPATGDLADIRASVPGTVEAKAAALEALLPTRKSIAAGTPPDVTVSYAGEPKFEPIKGADVSRAVNSGNDVILYEGTYYLCYDGAWYASSSATGPWTATATVPDAIYKIPPESPAYSVTQVTVYETTPSTIVYSYPPSYSTDVYVAYGVPWYGTGWYYPPYIYGPYYYPYYTSYGHGYWYSPVTGAYGSRSVWYGPYGGYSYSQGYNPRTGRYGYVETAWDGEDWKSHSEKYNPRTGIATETSRHYSANDNKAKMSRTVEGQNGAVQMERKTDFDNRTMTTNRETSRGGSSSTTRTGDGSGTITKSGTVTTGGGKTATIEGERTIGQGGTTTITGSGGGEAKSISQGGNRTTVGQSGSGDIYAGHNGNVYKKTDDGWQHYENGGWQGVEKPDRPAGGGNAASTRPSQAPAYSSEAVKPSTTTRPGGSYSGGSYPGGSYSGSRPSDRYNGGARPNDNMSQLDRDARARSGGYDRFQQRRSAAPSGGFSRGGGMRGGGRRR